MHAHAGQVDWSSCQMPCLPLPRVGPLRPDYISTGIFFSSGTRVQQCRYASVHMTANEIVAAFMASAPTAVYGWRAVCPSPTNPAASVVLRGPLPLMGAWCGWTLGYRCRSRGLIACSHICRGLCKKKKSAEMTCRERWEVT